jgi:hypothetical protein
MAKKTSKKAERSSAATPEETPAEKFKRLAKGRVDTANKQIALLAAMTGTAYESTDVERRAIVESLKASVDGLEKVYTGKAKKAGGFSFPDE